MARSIKEIKRSMTEAYMRHPHIASAYGLPPNSSFEAHFSQVSLENILFYVFASAVWLVETLVEHHRTEVAQMLDERLPHTLRWYAIKAKGYMHGYRLSDGSDSYDTSGLSPRQIDEAQVVRYAVATESSTIVYLKVAGADAEGQPQPLGEDVLSGLSAYIAEVKDAGVAVELINQPADIIQLTLDLYVGRGVMTSDEARQTLADEVRHELRTLLRALPFDGTLRLSAVVQRIEGLTGIESASVRSARSRPHSGTQWVQIESIHRPVAGYWTLGDVNITYHHYNRYDGL